MKWLSLLRSQQEPQYNPKDSCIGPQVKIEVTNFSSFHEFSQFLSLGTPKRGASNQSKMTLSKLILFSLNLVDCMQETVDCRASVWQTISNNICWEGIRNSHQLKDAHSCRINNIPTTMYGTACKVESRESNTDPKCNPYTIQNCSLVFTVFTSTNF